MTELVKLAPDFYVPKDFETNHHYYADAGGEKEYTGVTSVLGVNSKDNITQWAADMAAITALENAAHYPALRYEYETAKASKNDGDRRAAIKALDRKYPLYREARFAHRKKKEDAATKGTDVHKTIEEWVKVCLMVDGGKPLPKNPPEVDAFAYWARSENIRFLEAEKRLYSKEHWIAGTCDLVFQKDGKTYIGDIKTYKKLWDRVPMLQCAGYGLMWEEMEEAQHDKTDTSTHYPREIDGYCVIRIKDDFEVKWSYDVEGDRAGFLAALTLYRTLQQWVA